MQACGKAFQAEKQAQKLQSVLGLQIQQQESRDGGWGGEVGEKGKADRTRAGLHKARETSINPYFSLETGSLGRIWVWKYSKPGMTSAWVTP